MSPGTLHLRPFRAAPPFAIAIAALALVGAARTARTLPLFGDAGGSCRGCHTTGTRLNAAGIAFAERGYREEHGTSPHVRPLSLVGGTGLAVTHFGSLSTAAFRGISDASMRGNGVHAAGVSGRFSYHVNLGFTGREDEPQTEAAFVQLDDLVGKGVLNLRAGRFDAELPFVSRARRSTLAGYLSPTTFDARGFELDGRRADWGYAAAVAFSDRRMQGGAAPRRVADPLEDSYFRLTRDVGGQSFGAQLLFDRQDSPLRTLSWVQHVRGQLAATLGGPRFSLIPSYVFDRFDDRPSAGVHERHQYYMVETVAELDPHGRWAMTGRYEHDYRTRNVIDPEAHRQLEAVDLAWRAMANAQLAVEWSNSDDRSARRKQDQFDALVRASW